MQTKPHTTNLASWPVREAAQKGLEMKALIDQDGEPVHPAMEALYEALKLRENQILTELLTKKATNEGAMYAKAVGHMDGLREVAGLALGVLRNGRDAEEILRNEKETESG